MSGISVFNVGFHEQGIDVTYAEERDADPGGQVMMQRSIMIDGRLIAEEILEMMELVQEAVDKALTALEAATRRPGRKMPDA